MKKVYTVGALALMFAACTPSSNVTTPSTSGRANFTNYLAIGCSYTAGFADNSLYVSGQLNSYPQRLFEQFGTITDGQGALGPFIQPLVTGENGYPNPKLVLGTINYCDGTSALGPMDNPLPLDSVGSSTYNSGVNNGQINNIGVPFIRVADFPVVGYAGLNKYARRFFYDPSKRPLDELYARVYNTHPTFFSFWLGMYDILGFAAAGGQGDGTGEASPVALNIYNTNDITPRKVFTDVCDSILTAATSISSGGAVLNLPDITALPFFTTVPANGLVITRKTQADSLHALYKSRGYDIVFQEGANYFVIKDHDDLTRQAVPGELLLLTVPRDSITCAGWGTVKPIPREYVLTTDELQQIRNMTEYVNSWLQQQCQLRGLAYVDVHAFMENLSSGMAYNGIDYSTSYVSGGAYSLDGVHLNPRGNALLANYVIQSINAYYGSTIPNTDANRYPGVKFP